MGTTKTDICIRAAGWAGFGALTSLDDNAQVALLVEQHYDAIAAEMLTEHGWKFARKSGAMQLTTVVPEKPWAQAWRKPVGLLSLQYVQTAEGVRIDQEERDTDQGACCVVLSEFDTPLVAVGVFRVDEAVWPADFAMAVQHRIEAVFLAAVAEQRTEADARDKLSAGKQQRSRTRDQRASTATDPSQNCLAAARGRSAAWSPRGYR